MSMDSIMGQAMRSSRGRTGMVPIRASSMFQPPFPV